MHCILSEHHAIVGIEGIGLDAADEVRGVNVAHVSGGLFLSEVPT